MFIWLLFVQTYINIESIYLHLDQTQTNEPMNIYTVIQWTVYLYININMIHIYYIIHIFYTNLNLHDEEEDDDDSLCQLYNII